ncbi:ATP-binding protein [Sporosarcina sp. YIM B06819]|uniref:ATP-binding protein n=1 Tax=Sporosarcina sp. YIM B06819 TaxID=3081769 RepID=UPI00298C634C|nr:ATP-binding protein [Sporosarcina sp. YIM B06819]
MKYNKENETKRSIFLLNEASRPGAVFDCDGTLLSVNKSFCKEFCLQEMENIQEFIAGQSMNLKDEIKKRVIGSDYKTFDMTFQLAHGRERVAKVHLMYFDEDQQILALFAVLHSTYTIAEKVYEHAFRHSDNCMLIIDKKGIIFDINDKHTEFFNLPKDYFVGKPGEILAKFFLEDSATYIKHMKEVNRYGYAETTRKYEKSSGDIRYYHITTLFDSESQTYLVVMNDRTEKVILEDRLAHTGSLSTVGELAASIAHEIRNPMTTIKGFIQLLKLSANDDSMKYLSVIDDEVMRMESILGEMLVLSKPTLNKKTTFSLEVLVDDMIQVVHPKALMEGITIRQEVSRLPNTLIVGDADKIKQVLLNLFKNAFEAMSPGGVLTTSMKMDDIGQFVLSISDTGKGMSENQLNQVFMPFFTSKPEGTGLGLPFVLKIIEEHGGTISVTSNVDQGTTFIVTFPGVNAHAPGEFLDEKRLLSS